MSLMFALALLATPDPAPTDFRVDAFTAACIPNRQDQARMAQALAADGWVQVADDDHPELATTMATARAGMVDPEIKMTGEVSVWGRTIETRRLYVVLTRISAVLSETEDSDGDGVIQEWEQENIFEQVGCGLWDFDASAPIDLAAMTAWAGSEPVQVVDAPGLVWGGTWNVYDKLPGTGEIHMGFIPEDSPTAATAFSGASISMSSAPLDTEPEPD